MSGERLRFHAFDVLRPLAIFAVVWIHGCDTSALTRQWSVHTHFAVPVFVLMSFFLLYRSLEGDREKSFAGVLGCRLYRLLPPYLAWTCLYMMVRMAKHRVLGSGDAPDNWISAVFFGGASYQLYFVALLIYWMVLFLPLMMLVAHRPQRWHVFAFAVSGLVLLWGGAVIHARISAPPEYSMVNHAMGLTGYVPLAVAAGIAWKTELLPPPRRGAWAWLLLLSVPAARVLGLDGRLVISMCLFMAAVIGDWPQVPAMVSRLSRLSFGIFMVHGFFVEGLQSVFPAAGISVSTASGAVGVIVGSFTASYLACELLWRIRRLRWLVA